VQSIALTPYDPEAGSEGSEGEWKASSVAQLLARLLGTNEAETFACDDFCKRGSLCAAFVIALYQLVGPYPVRSLRAGSFNSRPAAATARLAVFMLARIAAFEPKWDSVKRRSQARPSPSAGQYAPVL
jgi:hypothetical protein